MAKLTSRRFTKKSEAGEVLDFVSDVSVSSVGDFWFTIPDDFSEHAQKYLKAHADKSHGIRVAKGSSRWAVIGKELDLCATFISSAINDFLQCEKHEELVIAYRTDTQVSYAKTSEGIIYPNGIGLKEWTYYGKLHATERRKVFSIGLSARVFNKITFKRPSGETSKYENPERPNFSTELYLDKLNNFTGLSLHPEDGCKFLPYSEEAAKFFYDSMIGLCTMADRIDAFFADDSNVQKAILSSSNVQLLEKV